MTELDEQFLALSAATGRFSYGAPRAFTFSADGTRLLLLRSGGPRDPFDRLWQLDLTTGRETLLADPAVLAPGRTGDRDDLPVLERRLRERTRLVARGIGSFAATPDATTAVFALDGRLFRAGPDGTAELPTAGPAFDPRPNADGSVVAYVAEDVLYLT
ncbi:S9 family peptidase, partial [Kitasatospora sp. NPDC058965]